MAKDFDDIAKKKPLYNKIKEIKKLPPPEWAESDEWYNQTPAKMRARGYRSILYRLADMRMALEYIEKYLKNLKKPKLRHANTFIEMFARWRKDSEKYEREINAIFSQIAKG